MGSGGRGDAEVVASGIIKIYFLDFLEQLTTFRTEGPHPRREGDRPLPVRQALSGRPVERLRPPRPLLEPVLVRTRE